LRTTIEIIQKVRTFLNFGLVEEREKKVEKKKYSRRRYSWQYMLVRTKHYLVTLHLRWRLCIFDTGGGVTCRLNGADNLHMLVCSYHVAAAFYFFLIFINTKIHLTSHKIYKRKQSAEIIDTPKNNNICFKIQEYFGNLIMPKEKIKKSLLLKQSKILLPWVFRTYIMQSREEKIYIPLSILQY